MATTWKELSFLIRATFGSFEMAPGEPGRLIEWSNFSREGCVGATVLRNERLQVLQARERRKCKSIVEVSLFECQSCRCTRPSLNGRLQSTLRFRGILRSPEQLGRTARFNLAITTNTQSAFSTDVFNPSCPPLEVVQTPFVTSLTVVSNRTIKEVRDFFRCRLQRGNRNRHRRRS